MDCDICSRSQGFLLPFYCVACARGTIYASRLELAKVLLDKEQLGAKIEDTVLQDDPKLDKGREGSDVSRAWVAQRNRAQKIQSETRRISAEEHARTVRHEVEQLRHAISLRRADLLDRKANLAPVKEALLGRQTAKSTGLEDMARRGSLSFDNQHLRTTEIRGHICKELVGLLGLKQKRRQKDGFLKEQYFIGGLPIVDLTDINNLRCTELTATLSSIAHLVALAAFYLAVRLPAEVTLPHRDYPLTTISTPASSYTSNQTLPHSATLGTSSSNSPAVSRSLDPKAVSRPRPLSLGNSEEKDQKVAQVARDDPTSFNLFIEGVSLLAWDVVWLSRSQGFSNGSDSWEDACKIGRNLWQLLASPTQPSKLVRNKSKRDVPDAAKSNSGHSTPSSAEAKPIPKLGDTSHASAHSFLGTTDAHERFQSWGLSKYTMIADPLKRLLLADMKNAEWELLEEQEWDDGGEHFDEAVFVKARAMNGREYDDARSVMTARSRMEDVQQAEEPPEYLRAKGTSGWTKLKSRD